MPYLPHWPIPSTLGKREINYESVFERMEIVLKKLGNPHKKLPPVIHVAGTNGKGSTVALLAKIYQISGYKTHIYTSPHLHNCNERIVLDGEKISDNFLFEIMEEVRIAADDTPLTFFESFTIGAFLAFSKVPADIVIIECGMGGRIDATNIIEKKLATIITPISFDHMEYLGDTIEKIALQKAMIMRPKTPLIVGSQPSQAKRIIEILAKDQKAPSYFYDEDFFIELDEETKNFDLHFAGENLLNLPQPALLGQHQYINFSVAIACVLTLKEKFPITKNAINQAISTVFWPSRLEKINYKNLEIFLDGAHNEAGAFALAKFIAENKNKKNFVIVGFSKNKCKKEFLEKFRDISEIIAVRVDGEPNPESSKTIVEVGKKIGMEIIDCDNLLEAFDHIIKTQNQVSIFICGSLHLARDVKKFLK